MEGKDETNSTDEIEITAAMIRAGVSAFYASNDWGREPAEFAVDRIYRAMRAAGPAVEVVRKRPLRGSDVKGAA